VDFYQNGCIEFICFHSQLTYNISHLHNSENATPPNNNIIIHTEVAWSSLNNCQF